MSSVVKITDSPDHRLPRLELNVGTKVRLRGTGKIGGIGTITKLVGIHSAVVKWQSGFHHTEYITSLTKVK